MFATIVKKTFKNFNTSLNTINVLLRLHKFVLKMFN